MTVIYQTTEDAADDTVVPRFIASNGDRNNLIFISEDKKHLTFGDSRLAQAIKQTGAKLLILDPLSSYIGEDCSLNAANEMRTQFNHLIETAQPHERQRRYRGRSTQYSGGDAHAKQGKSAGKNHGSGEVESCADRLGDPV